MEFKILLAFVIVVGIAYVIFRIVEKKTGLNTESSESRLVSTYECGLCSYVYDENVEEISWKELPENWTCPVCGSGRQNFTLKITREIFEASLPQTHAVEEEYLAEWQRFSETLRFSR